MFRACVPVTPHVEASEDVFHLFLARLDLRITILGLHLPPKAFFKGQLEARVNSKRVLA